MTQSKLPISFYEKYTTCELAQQLLGCELVHDSAEGKTSGIIVETEAYLADDPACHAYQRVTPRTAPMYDSAGHIYIYQIYGMHQCFNVVSNQKGIGEAVLIRALQPKIGIELMKERRFGKQPQKRASYKDIELCNGPAKLVVALGISRSEYNHKSLVKSEVYIQPRLLPPPSIIRTTRIGINVGKHLEFRYYIQGNPFVSKF
jgi:DNA-3-methyladenine glycosylase